MPISYHISKLILVQFIGLEYIRGGAARTTFTKTTSKSLVSAYNFVKD